MEVITIITVFLGGTCNNSTWRSELISKLDTTKITVFNPVVEIWDEKAKENEIWHRENDDLCLYVLTPEMIGDTSVGEIIVDSNSRPNKTIVCILEENKKPFNNFQKSKVLIARIMILEHKIPLFFNLDEVANYINSYNKEDLSVKKRTNN